MATDFSSMQNQKSPEPFVPPAPERFSVFPEQPQAERPVQSPEVLAPVESVEAHPQIEHEQSALDKAIDGLKRALRVTKPKKPTTIPQVRDELTLQVEKILEEELGDAFAQLTLIQQQEFKIKGEQTAFEIRQLLRKTHVNIKKVFELILEWLKLLPGVNRFFLEQEAKIKADKIMALKRSQE